MAEKVAPMPDATAPPPGYGLGMDPQPGGCPPPPHMAPMHPVPLQQHTVVVTQPVVGVVTSDIYPQNKQAWINDLLGCFGDCGICLCGTFCPVCLACQVASHMGESCSAGWLCGGVFPMRVKLRTMLGITGSIDSDCIITACCGPCALCQMEREMKSRSMC